MHTCMNVHNMQINDDKKKQQEPYLANDNYWNNLSKTVGSQRHASLEPSPGVVLVW